MERQACKGVGPGLAEPATNERHAGVPRGGIALEPPAPIGVERQQRRAGSCDGAGDVRSGGVDGDDMVEGQACGGGVGERGELRAPIGGQGKGMVRSGGSRALQADPRDAAKVRMQKVRELSGRDRPGGVVGMGFAAGPDETDVWEPRDATGAPGFDGLGIHTKRLKGCVEPKSQEVRKARESGAGVVRRGSVFAGHDFARSWDAGKKCRGRCRGVEDNT